VKIQCQKCEEIVPIGNFQSSSAGIRVTCSACDASFFVPATPRRASTAADGDAKAADCPKCGGAVPASVQACPACGLSSERFADFARDALVDEDELSALWSACEQAWEDPAAHDAFVAAASASGAFSVAARRYRTALGRRGDDAIASERLARVARMAEAALLARARAQKQPESEPYKGVVLLLVGLVFFAIAGALFLFVRVSANDRDGGEIDHHLAPHYPPAHRGATGGQR
jgi:hypothetical protein